MDSTKQSRQLVLIAAVLVLATAAVYGQLRGHDTIHFDDHAYVVDNYMVQRGITWAGVRSAFATDEWSNWHPVTWLSHMLDCQWFGTDAGLHHLSSLALHIANTLLLLLLLHRMTGALWRPGLVAALFALHPLNVESVAWIAERKNVLSTFFWLSTTLSYVTWSERPSAWRYTGTLVLLALGLMAKPMLVTLPFTLLLLDFWPLRRTRLLAPAALESSPARVQHALRRLVIEKLPLLALVVVSSCVTFALHRDLAAAASRAYPIGLRVANAIVSYGAYLAHTVWPHDLAIVYPLRSSVGALAVVASGVLLAAISAWVVRARERRPDLLVGWSWYLGTLVPVIGLVQVGGHTLADRYAYVPLIGVFVMIAWSSAACIARWPSIRGAVVGCSVAALVVLGAQTWRQTALWKNSVTLFEHTLSVTEDNAVIEGALGVALGELGRQAEAVPHLVEALRLTPDSPVVLHDLGSAYASLGRLDEAMKCFREALAIRPDAAETHTLLAFTLARLGRKDEALEHYRAALRLKPDYSEVHLGLAALYESQQQSREAIEHYREVLRFKPRSIEALTNLGALLAARGEYAQAIGHFRAVLELDPRRIVARNNLGHALAALGKTDEAAARFTESLAIDPNQPQVRSKLASLRAAPAPR